MNGRQYIVDIMRLITEKVSIDLLPSLQAVDSFIRAVNYEYGHPLEILETLKQKDESKTLRYNKYPLVALLTDVEEKKGLIGVTSQMELNLLVVNSTEPTFKAEERRQKNFIPIIHPIVDSLVQQIALSPYFMEFDPDLIERSETDRFYWGRISTGGTDANVANDYLDATEVNIQVRLNAACVLKNFSTNL